MQLQTFPVIEPLSNFIEKIWLYKSDDLVGEDDLKMIVPNGRIKLIIPFNNVLTFRQDFLQEIVLPICTILRVANVIALPMKT